MVEKVFDFLVKRNTPLPVLGVALLLLAVFVFGVQLAPVLVKNTTEVRLEHTQAAIPPTLSAVARDQASVAEERANLGGTQTAIAVLSAATAPPTFDLVFDFDLLGWWAAKQLVTVNGNEQIVRESRPAISTADDWIPNALRAALPITFNLSGQETPVEQADVFLLWEPDRTFRTTHVSGTVYFPPPLNPNLSLVYVGICFFSDDFRTKTCEDIYADPQPRPEERPFDIDLTQDINIAQDSAGFNHFYVQASVQRTTAAETEATLTLFIDDLTLQDFSYASTSPGA